MNDKSTTSAGDLRRRSVDGVLWGTLGTVFRALLQIGAQIMLARMLGPEIFGLFAIALVIVLFGNFFADAGLAYGLIQRENVTQTDVRFVFTWQICLGIFLTVILWSVAPWVATFYGDERVVAVLQWLSLTCLINAIGSTAQTLLRREMDFKTINLAAVVSYAVGFLVIGIPLAIAGFGVFSLVAAFLVQTTIAAFIAYSRVRHSLRPLWRHPSPSPLLRFAAVVFGTNVVNWILTSYDRIVIGRLLDVSAAGLYSTISNFILSPSLQVLTLLQSVLYSAGARVQGESERLGNALRAMIGVVALTLGPIFLAIAVVAPTIVEAVYGVRWVGGGAVLAPFSIAVLAYLVMGMATPILWNTGRITAELKWQIPIALLWVVCLPLVARTGSVAVVSWMACLLYYVRAAVLLAATMRAVQMRAAQLPAVLIAGLIVSGLVAVVAALTDSMLAAVIPVALLRLVVVVIACAVALPVGVLIARRWVSADVARLLHSLVARAPGSALLRAYEKLLPQAVPG